MSDVRTVDLLKFLDTEVIPKRKLKLEQEQKIYDNYKKEYDKTPKYRRYFMLSPATSPIDWAEYKLEVAENFRKKVFYNLKCEIEMTSLKFEARWDEWFYKWANDNGVPY